MRIYFIVLLDGLDPYTKLISADGYNEAESKALTFGHKVLHVKLIGSLDD